MCNGVVGTNGIRNRYGMSKLGQVLHIKSLEKRFGPTATGKSGEVYFASVHPGMVDT